MQGGGVCGIDAEASSWELEIEEGTAGRIG